MLRHLVVYFLLLATHAVVGQKQLILLKGEKVVLRLRSGEAFVYQLKNSKQIKSSYINNLADTAVVVHHDTIPFRKIERIYFRQRTFYNYLGGFFIQAGALLFVADQVNNSLIRGNTPSLDEGVSLASLSFIGAGIPMVLTKKKSQRINYPYRLMMVEKGSIFYEKEPEGFESPGIPE